MRWTLCDVYHRLAYLLTSPNVLLWQILFRKLIPQYPSKDFPSGRLRDLFPEFDAASQMLVGRDFICWEKWNVWCNLFTMWFTL